MIIDTSLQLRIEVTSEDDYRSKKMSDYDYSKSEVMIRARHYKPKTYMFRRVRYSHYYYREKATRSLLFPHDQISSALKFIHIQLTKESDLMIYTIHKALNAIATATQGQKEIDINHDFLPVWLKDNGPEPKHCTWYSKRNSEDWIEDEIRIEIEHLNPIREKET